MPRFFFALLFGALALVAVSPPAQGSTAPSNSVKLKKVLYRGTLPDQLTQIQNGAQKFRVRLYSKDGALVHEEELTGQVKNGSYDIVLGSTTPLYRDVNDLALAISVNGSKEVKCCSNLSDAMELPETITSTEIDQLVLGPITPNEISARAVERWAIANGLLKDAPLTVLPAVIQHAINPMTGLKMEIALATPYDEKMASYYQAGKYGRINVEYNNMITIGNDQFGVVGQAMHVAHHMLFYSGGITSDVNNDGTFMFTVGAAHYRVGNRRYEPFIDAPFMRIKYASSPEKIFLYTELETTMHVRSLVTGTVGVGFRLSPMVKVIGGLHHTEFWMPTERQNRIVEGLHGIFSWGI